MIDTAVGVLNVPELEALVLLNVDLAERYQAIADDRDAEPQTRGTAEALAAWRRARARYSEKSAQRPSASRPRANRISVMARWAVRDEPNPKSDRPPPE